MSSQYLNASRISSSQPSSFFFRTIIERNSGNSMVPLPMTSDLQNWKQNINCCNLPCAKFQHVKHLMHNSINKDNETVDLCP